jgi:hypothetical protein
MRGSRFAIALVTLCGCNQLLGIDDGELDTVPAIAGAYTIGIDFRPNSTLDTVILLQGTIEYDRDARVGSVTATPLTAASKVTVGTPWVFEIEVTEGSQTTYSSASITGDVPAEANPQAMTFAISGTVAGVFQSESAFCGVISGTFTTTDPAAATPLPSVTFGALKNSPSTDPVQVNCNGDQFP